MSDNSEEVIEAIRETTHDWTRNFDHNCTPQTMNLSGDQKRFQDFITYLRNDATEKLPTQNLYSLNDNGHKRPAIPYSKDIVLKSDCGYSYYQTEIQRLKVIESIKEPHPTPTLFESIMSYFKLAIKA